MPSETSKPKQIEVHVAFPIAPSGPLNEKFDPGTALGQIREAAMAHFGVAPDAQHAYYLTHDGVKEADDLTVGGVAEPARSVKFTLVKELIQG